MKEQVIDLEVLNRECAVFCRYLIGNEPNDYVKSKYREGHRSRSFARGYHSSPSDAFLVKIASMTPWATKVIDAYARVFRQSSLVRRKLVLLLAILESCAPTHASLDSVDRTSIELLFLRSFQRVLTFVLLVILSALLIVPVELAVRASAKLIVIWLPRHG